MKRLCLIALSLLLLASCEKQLRPVDVRVKDPIRHYYPVVQGEILGITYEVENTDDDPLFIQEVQTTCGCIIPRDELPIVVLPHRTGFVHLDFNTIKNSGYVEHHVYCYGNFRDTAYVHLTFDTNVVPSADYAHDYEQLWHEQQGNSSPIRDFVDGKSSQKGYTTPKDEDPRAATNERVQDFVDRHTP